MPHQTKEPTTFEYLRARAAVARALVVDGILHPEAALAYAVWPTKKMIDAELSVNRFTIASRAFSRRANP